MPDPAEAPDTVLSCISASAPAYAVIGVPSTVVIVLPETLAAYSLVPTDIMPLISMPLQFTLIVDPDTLPAEDL